MFNNKNKQKPIVLKKPWVITPYITIQNKGEVDEFEEGFIEFEHRETSIESHKILIRREIGWINGDKNYIREIPTLAHIWEMLLKAGPGANKFLYKNWVIELDQFNSCSVYQLADRNKNEYVHKDITANSRIHFYLFLKMLDKYEKQRESLEKKNILNLSDVRKKKVEAG